MIVTLIPLLFIITLETSRSSLIFDDTTQKGLHVSDYCPKMKYCKEGTHVMCMFYDPDRVYGPRCHNSANITVNAELANRLLEVANMIRSKVAFGKENGKDGKRLPRGYGIMRLKWDNELATFAQILVNQCMLRHDLCRATSKFSSPSQSAGIVRLSYPDWMPAVNPKGIKYIPGIVNTPKLMYAITKSLSTWYLHRTHVTVKMIESYPDWLLTPNITFGKQYLDLVHGPATHMGCGISGYTQYTYFYTIEQGVHNNIQLVCNFSAGARKGSRVYETVAPTGKKGYSAKCGCPPGTKEDSDCLCNEVTVEHNCNYGETGNCDPTLVLLPIFTMEDAPPEKLYEIADNIKDPLKNFILQRVNNSNEVNINARLNAGQSEEAFDIHQDKDYENDIWLGPHKRISDQTPISSHKNIHRSRAYLDPDSKPPPPPPRRPFRPPRPLLRPRASRYQTRHPPPPVPPRIPPPPPPTAEYTTVLKIHEDSILASCDERPSRPLPRPPIKHRPVTKKSSIFTKIPQFQSPTRKKMASPSEVVTSNSIQRKINSNLNKVVNDYEHRAIEHETSDEHQEQNEPKEKTKHYIEDTLDTDIVTETGLNKAEEVVINFNQYLKQKNDTKYTDKDVDIKDDNDNKLLTLLDNLEQEVKHVALDGNERELFDVKLRKIYGTVIGKTASIQFPKQILQTTAGLEETEIDFGETKSVDKLELNHREDKVVEEPIKRTKHHQIAKNVGAKSYDYLSHKRKNKLDDSYVNIKPSEVYEHIYNDNFDNSYGDIDYKYMSDDHKYNDNFYKKKSDNNFDYEHNAQHKVNDNYNRQNHYHLKKHDDDDGMARIKKYEVTKAVFREFGNSNEETPKMTGYHLPDNDNPDRKGLIAKDIDKIKRTERIHRNKVKSLNSHNNFDDPLDFERRKYYQDKLYKIRKRLRSRKNRRDFSTDRSRRTYSKNRESSRTKSKSDDFYVPERPGFLHGF